MAENNLITEKDGWLCDENGNRNSIEYWGSREKAEAALKSLKNCKNCTNCSYCSHCSDCSYCSDCSRCSRCSDCSYCSDCSRCSGKKGAKPAETIEPLAVPKIENIHQKVFAAVSLPGALNMRDWHTCETTHCRA